MLEIFLVLKVECCKISGSVSNSVASLGSHSPWHKTTELLSSLSWPGPHPDIVPVRAHKDCTRVAAQTRDCCWWSGRARAEAGLTDHAII